MKKILGFLMAIAVLFMPIMVNADGDEKEKINVYVFYAAWCGNCTNLHNFLDELVEDKDYNYMFNVVYYRIDNDSKYGENPYADENSALMQKVGDYFENDGGYIPYYIIGSEDNTGFSSENTPAVIKDLIKKAYESKDYKDIVKTIGEGHYDDLKKKEEKKKIPNNVVGYIMLGVAAVIIGAIIISRASNAPTYYEDMVALEEKKTETTKAKEETKKEEKPKTTKTTTKNTKPSSTKKKTTTSSNSSKKTSTKASATKAKTQSTAKKINTKTAPKSKTTKKSTKK